MPTSAETFFNSVFGGAHAGLNRFFQQQDQATSLALTLHRMMQDQTNADRSFGLQEKQFGAIERERVQNRNAAAGRFGYERLQDTLAQLRQQKLDVSAEQRSQAQIKALNALAGLRGAQANKATDSIGKFTTAQLISMERDYKNRKAKAKQLGALREQLKGNKEAMKFIPEPEQLPDSFDQWVVQQGQQFKAANSGQVQTESMDFGSMSDEQISSILEQLLQ